MEAEQAVHESVKDWLVSLGLSNFEALFQQQQILTLQIVCEVEEADLEAWNVQPVPRRIFVRAIRELKERLAGGAGGGGEGVTDSGDEEDESYAPSVESDDHELDGDMEEEEEDNSLEETMQIIVKIYGRNISYDVRPNSTVLQLKEAIHLKKGIPVNQQRLIHSRKQLEDCRTLSDYDIKKQYTIT
eukprot:1779285-Ditylum_brightwellii.AAC.1